MMRMDSGISFSIPGRNSYAVSNYRVYEAFSFPFTAMIGLPLQTYGSYLSQSVDRMGDHVTCVSKQLSKQFRVTHVHVYESLWTRNRKEKRASCRYEIGILYWRRTPG